MFQRETLRKARHARTRKRMAGEAERPRLNVYRSLNHIYAQIIDDDGGCTIVAASTIDKDLKEAAKNGGNIEGAKAVGKMIAERALAKGIKKVIFDRGGYQYHGRVKALAETARESGLEF